SYCLWRHARDDRPQRTAGRRGAKVCRRARRRSPHARAGRGLRGRRPAAIEQIITAHGRLDVVIHNAGHMVFGPAEAFTPEQFAELYDVNVLSAQRVNRAALPQLRRQGKGLLIWVSSSSSAGGTPPYLAPYFAAKAARRVAIGTAGGVAGMVPAHARANVVPEVSEVGRRSDPQNLLARPCRGVGVDLTPERFLTRAESNNARRVSQWGTLGL